MRSTTSEAAGRRGWMLWTVWLLTLGLGWCLALGAGAQPANEVLEHGAPDPWGGSGTPSGEVVTLETTRGGLLYPTGRPGEYVEAPALATRVHLEVVGPLARGRVTQRFTNDGEGWREAIYVFPLPPDAAVDALRMLVGDRVIEGRIAERAAARRTYQTARREGRRASLVEQERPNLFTTSVANIGPGDAIEVEIEYQQVLTYDAGDFRLRFPMVVAPRFIPGTPLAAPAARIASLALPATVVPDEGCGWAPATDRVPDASRITPPVSRPTESGRNRLELTVALDPGFELARLDSRYHPVYIRETGPARYAIELQGGETIADRDFELEWTPRLGAEPKAALFSRTLGDHAYALLMVMPPAAGAEAVRLPRETVLVIDVSGSMHGDSIAQARAALASALDRLSPEDRFEIIAFNDRAHPLFGGSVPATRGHLERARRLVDRLEADGGTQILAALEAATATEPLGGDSTRRVRQVVFVTDGAVGNEEELFAFLERRLGDRRLFTVGIGSAPNAHFMQRAASFGRGSFTYVGSPEEVEERIGELFVKLEAPRLTDLEIDWPEAAEVWPERLPDLYSGEPLVVAARLSRLDGEVTVRGERAGRAWSRTLDLGGGGASPGVDKLWARRKIAALMDGGTRGETSAEELRARVVEVALAHHLVSRFTSLVAVDVTPARPAGEGLVSRPVPVELANGMSHQRVFGTLPTGATPAGLYLLLALLLAVGSLLAARAPRSSGGAR